LVGNVSKCVPVAKEVGDVQLRMPKTNMSNNCFFRYNTTWWSGRAVRRLCRIRFLLQFCIIVPLPRTNACLICPSSSVLPPQRRPVDFKASQQDKRSVRLDRRLTPSYSGSDCPPTLFGLVWLVVYSSTLPHRPHAAHNVPFLGCHTAIPSNSCYTHHYPNKRPPSTFEPS
jgi:hypothetical protein